MNTNDFLRLGVPLGQSARLPPSFHFGATSAMDFISKFILGGGKSGLHKGAAVIVANPPSAPERLAITV